MTTLITDARGAVGAVGARSERVARETEPVESALARLAADPTAVDQLLRELGTDFFPVEGGWRRLFAALTLRRDERTDVVRLALEDYLAWLRRRAARGRPEAAPAPSDEAAGESASLEMVRLRRGETVPITLGPGDFFVCLLATVPARLRAGDAAVMIVPGGRVYPLAPGRTHVGRAHDNQIAIDARYSDVSRRHLAVDRTPGGRLRLTDLSSRGTWVELRAVGRG
ncbi:MAG: FHA domain-containing protein [Ectothiorhodospiraceae bacterium]|nr:FHA domain-containing protein [Ectothiorhodospiraceae bacterium]